MSPSRGRNSLGVDIDVYGGGSRGGPAPEHIVVSVDGEYYAWFRGEPACRHVLLAATVVPYTIPSALRRHYICIILCAHSAGATAGTLGNMANYRDVTNISSQLRLKFLPI